MEITEPTTETLPLELTGAVKEARQKIIDASKPYPYLWWTLKNHVNTRGERMRFANMHYLIPLYKDFDKLVNLVVIKSVQVGLSELFISASHYEASKGMSVFYVLPKYEIRNRFVSNRIFRLHKSSMTYHQYLMEAKKMGGSYRIALVHFGKGGIAYIGSNVDTEFIEIPVDSAYIDEYDKCNQLNIALVPSRLTASPYKYQREISNPTIEDFGIDSRYKESSQANWLIKCDHCGNWFTPNFFKHVVRQISARVYVPLDKDDSRDFQIYCDKCHKPVDRTKKGEWVHRFPDKLLKGFQIGQEISAASSMRALVTGWDKAVGNEMLEQIFFNMQLGRAFSSKGSKIFDYQLDACKRLYEWPVVPYKSRAVRSMGVDVNVDLNVVIRERETLEGMRVRKLLYSGVLSSFSELSTLIKTWKPTKIVIDAHPEIHKVSDLKQEFPTVYSSEFQINLIEMTIDKKKRLVKMDRTSILDAVKSEVDDETLVLPNADLPTGYYSQMTASARVVEVNEKDPSKSRFVWKEGSKADHFFLAEAYCKQADMLCPDSTALDYYTDVAEKITRESHNSELTKAAGLNAVINPENYIDTLPEEEKKKSVLTPDQFVAGMKKSFTNKEKSHRDVDSIEAEIESVVKQLLSVSKEIDIQKFSRLSGLHILKAESFLTSRGFVKIREGFYGDAT